MNYYTVCVFGEDIELGKRVRGCHIIKASSKVQALKIRERHGISNPRFAKGHFRITCDKINLNFKSDDGRFINQEMIERRKQGFGGNIWYEDEGGNLQRETI